MLELERCSFCLFYGKVARMENALNIVVFWAVYAVAVIIHFECVRRLFKVRKIEDPEDTLVGAWYKASLPWILGAWSVQSLDVLFFTPDHLGAYDGLIAFGLAALTFGGLMYFWGFGAGLNPYLETTYDHATDYTNNLMFTSSAMLVLFGVVCGLRLCGVEIDIFNAWKHFIIF